MPSFDIVSEVDPHELTNAVDQSSRELGKRFDFRGTSAAFELEENAVKMVGDSEFQLQQMMDILRQRLTARNIDVRCLEPSDIETNVSGARQTVKVKQGIEQATAKKIVAAIKASGLKADTQIQGEKLRVNAKKRDDLQAVMAHLRKTDLELPLQFDNFRD